MKFWLLLLVIVGQIIVLAGEYLNAIYPLWLGQEIKLKTIPVDPRSLFRGNYARLNYDISDVYSKNLPDNIRNGEIVYVSLKMNEKGIYEFNTISLTPPRSDMFIRGRIKQYYYSKDTYSVKYGIEAYFAPKEKALALENDLRSGGIAVVMVANNGKATLKSVIAN